MNEKLFRIFRVIFAYVIELSIFYEIAYLLAFAFKKDEADFYARLFTFFILLACLVNLAHAPHALATVLRRPAIWIVFVVNVVFGSLAGKGFNPMAILPGFGLFVLFAAFWDRVDRSHNKKRPMENQDSGPIITIKDDDASKP